MHQLLAECLGRGKANEGSSSTYATTNDENEVVRAAAAQANKSTPHSDITIQAPPTIELKNKSIRENNPTSSGDKSFGAAKVQASVNYILGVNTPVHALQAERGVRCVDDGSSSDTALAPLICYIKPGLIGYITCIDSIHLHVCECSR